MRRVARVNDLADVCLQGGEVLGSKRLRVLLIQRQFFAPGLELGQLPREVADSLPAKLLGHCLFLESAEVAVKRFVQSPELGLDALSLGFVLGPGGVEFSECLLDRSADERFLFKQ